MIINIKVKTLDAQTHEFSVDNELTIREFKDKVAAKTNIAADQQRIIYCGRVMVDDKQLKEYDVDGKVVHVAERPPPAQRLPTTDSSTTSNTNTPTERRSRTRPANMRNSPLFRAIDGMVVGTMALPMNAYANGEDNNVNPLSASSSFCMNRITVARHMLDCANNIAAYLEDPSRGLNNQSLDILARGRWTMESTVVEVGITSDIPQSTQIVEMVQGAVQVALRRNTNANVTLVQLPTLYSTNENEAASTEAAANDPASATENDESTSADNTNSGENNISLGPGSVIMEDVIDEDEDTPTNDQSDNNSTTVTPTVNAADENSENTAAGGNAEDNSRRRTGTPILATVIEQMRTVQIRLNPFIQQYYELLQNDANLEENEVENAQRLFDRVSEAFHYMSHAQHAISDLMLDVSQNTPRFLACRPILVEQSGYVRSNNFLTPTILPAQMRQQQARNATDSNSTANSATTATVSNSAPPSANDANSSVQISDSISDSSTSSDAQTSTVDDPMDEPPWQRINFNSTPTHGTTSNTNSASSRNNNSRANLQRHVSRLLQDVVSAAPFDTELHVHINSPIEIEIPIAVGVNNTGSVDGGTATSDTSNTSLNLTTSSSSTVGTTTSTSTSTSTSSDNTSNTKTSTSTSTSTSSDNTSNTNTSMTSSSSSSSTANAARVTTATLPTTSTQTRSTSRPQVHFGNIPVLGMPTAWNGRLMPNTNVSSFDRFLPCNSHHIREPEVPANANNDTGTPTRSNPSTANIVPRRQLRSINDVFQRMRPSSRIVGSTMTSSSRPTNNSTTPRFDLPRINIRDARELFGGRSAPNTASTSSRSAASNQDAQRSNIHTQLKTCLNNNIFEGQPINDDTIPPAINRAIQWFGESLLYLPQYEKPEYDSRDSLLNILRMTLPTVIDLFKATPSNLKEFEQKLKQICEQFRKRLYSVLYICIGQANAEIFWIQLMRLLCNSIQTNMQGDVVEFLAIYLTPTIPSATDEADAQQFIVFRKEEAANADNVQMTFVSPPNYFHSQPLDTDVEMSEVATTSQQEVVDEPLLPVVPGSDNWHRHFPNDWLPIITRDIQRQAENPPEQTAFSDAYISGMSSKRRKIIQNAKAPTEICALIADSVTKAIKSSGEVGTSANSVQGHTPETVAVAIATDPAVQSSCIDAVRTQVRERLKKDPDFEADKFPKSNKFINK